MTGSFVALATLFGLGAAVLAAIGLFTRPDPGVAAQDDVRKRRVQWFRAAGLSFGTAIGFVIVAVVNQPTPEHVYGVASAAARDLESRTFSGSGAHEWDVQLAVSRNGGDDFTVRFVGTDAESGASLYDITDGEGRYTACMSVEEQGDVVANLIAGKTSVQASVHDGHCVVGAP